MPWNDLEADVASGAAALAGCSARDCRRELAARVARLAEVGACPQQAPWWLDRRKGASRDAFAVVIAPSIPDRLGSHPCIRLEGLEHLEDGARLVIHVHVDPDAPVPAEYAIGLAGTVRGTGAPWFARLDLGDPGLGVGKCSHAALHGHLGADPDAGFQARAPLPWLTPWDALDWLLATVDRRFEPCPHV